MYEITFPKEAAGVLGLALFKSQPKNLDQFHAALGAKRALEGTVFRPVERQAGMLGFEPVSQESVKVRLEPAIFNYTREQFEAQRDDGKTFSFAQAEFVIAASEAFRTATRVAEPAKP